MFSSIAAKLNPDLTVCHIGEQRRQDKNMVTTEVLLQSGISAFTSTQNFFPFSWFIGKGHYSEDESRMRCYRSVTLPGETAVAAKLAISAD